MEVGKRHGIGVEVVQCFVFHAIVAHPKFGTAVAFQLKPSVAFHGKLLPSFVQYGLHEGCQRLARAVLLDERARIYGGGVCPRPGWVGLCTLFAPAVAKTPRLWCVARTCMALRQD